MCVCLCVRMCEDVESVKQRRGSRGGGDTAVQKDKKLWDF